MSWLRSCAHCSYSWGKTDLFCQSCWQDLWGSIEYKNKRHGDEQFNTSSLWSWKQEKTVAETLVHAQKGRGLLLARTRIVESYLSFLGDTKPQCLFYVSKNHKKDHGYEWALAFSQILQRPIRPLLIEGEENYKSKNRRQRQQGGRIQRVSGIEKSMAHDSWLIDDIRTTGTTARSAWEALNKPELFRAVVVVQRELC